MARISAAEKAKRELIEKSPSYIAYIDTGIGYDGYFDNTPGCIKHLVGSRPIYYKAISSETLLDAIREAAKLKREGVYLVDIYENTLDIDRFGDVVYANILRCRSHGFYPIEEDAAFAFAIEAMGALD